MRLINNHGEKPSSLLTYPLYRGIVIGFALGVVITQIAHSSTNIQAYGSPGRLFRFSGRTLSKAETSPPATAAPAADTETRLTDYVTKLNKERTERGLILPFERTAPREYLAGKTTDAYTYFHNYMSKLNKDSPTAPHDFGNLPMLHIWPIYFEAYHNHWQRYRGKKEVIFMEIGVQSGGKIPMLRDYFGHGLTYIGIDINPSTKMFESADWIHIEIGDAGNREFLESLVQKYPKVDIFLDDGGHFMTQQRLSMEIMLQHLQPDGVFMCEDLSTSWNQKWGGIPWGDSTSAQFRDTTTMGLVYRTIEWLNAGWMAGKVMQTDLNAPQLNNYWQDTPWWREFVKTVKHIHYYNQLVVYEKGIVETPYDTQTVGTGIPYRDSGVHEKVQWEPIQERLSQITKSSWR